MDIKFEPRDKVWFMYCNKPISASIAEIKVRSSGTTYWFWYGDFPYKDLNLVKDNAFSICGTALFKTKEELIKSL